ncbi:hypothetical protein TIFTF001_011862 [Ficus carica]|uniref:FAR1 domain-containing protein n=1 Tax=Ficus carica TaxID=3494 RepID=A0AA88D5R6_FICCA|nr:hypothetical protein TIFTF001_011862 [Ficus carica]
MKREGRQHGMVRTYRILPTPLNPRPDTRFINRFDSPATAGLFTRVPSKPTNHSKFTGKCGQPRCNGCHMHPTCKAKDKTKGNQKQRSNDVVSNHRSMDCHEPDISNHRREENGPKGSSFEMSQEVISGEECQTPKFSSVNKCEKDFDCRLESQSPNVTSGEVSETGSSVKDEEDIHLVPEVGMEFESEDHAYKCYSRYAVLEGFSIRKDFVNKSRINGAVVSRRYTCYRQGYRPNKQNSSARKLRQETRTGCLAHMTIARQPNGKRD